MILFTREEQISVSGRREAAMKAYDIHTPIQFKKGVHQLNEEANFNFQLNRVINWDGGRLEDVAPVSAKIKTSADWKNVLISLGDKAMEEERTENAIAYYRMSEFFMYDGDPDKKKYYQLATELFYDYYRDYFEPEGSGVNPVVERFQVPYEDVKLPVMHVVPKGEKKGTLLLHGGNDSYFEEFFFPILYLKDKGYEVYLFEGPGQGGVVRIQNKHFTHQWEKPVKAVLDYFKLEDVTIIGVSLGGYLAPRAAAFDTRITRVVAWSVFPCFLDVIIGDEPPAVQKLFYFLMKIRAKGLINWIFNSEAKKLPVIDWGLKHGMYAYEADSAYGYARKLKLYDMEPIADRITQDILIMGANQDHFINYHSIGKEIDMLTNVRSLTFRLFTDKEQAQDHCNCGNTKLALDTIMHWVEGINS